MANMLKTMTITGLRPSVSRRGLMLSAGAAGLAWASGAGRAFASTENMLRVGFISPRSGPLGGFGQTDGYVLDLVRAALKNGLKVGDKTVFWPRR
jgi:branched-chain amino acid transport system substrate-binding protein